MVKLFMTFRKKLRKLEKLSLKVNKANLDINFFLNCRTLSVIRKFLFSNLPYTNNSDAKAFRRRLLRSVLRKRNHGKLKLDKELNNLKVESATFLLLCFYV